MLVAGCSAHAAWQLIRGTNPTSHCILKAASRDVGFKLLSTLSLAWPCKSKLARAVPQPGWCACLAWHGFAHTDMRVTCLRQVSFLAKTGRKGDNQSILCR